MNCSCESVVQTGWMFGSLHLVDLIRIKQVLLSPPGRKEWPETIGVYFPSLCLLIISMNLGPCFVIVIGVRAGQRQRHSCAETLTRFGTIRHRPMDPQH